MFEESCNEKINYPIMGYAPGHYMSTYFNCEGSFMGDKYARQCEACAINSLKQSHENCLKTIKTLETKIEEYKTTIKILNEQKRDKTTA